MKLKSHSETDVKNNKPIVVSKPRHNFSIKAKKINLLEKLTFELN